MSRWWPLAALLMTVLSAPGARAKERVATVRGEVARPGACILSPGETLSSLIARAGGYADDAFLRGAVLTRRSAERAQKEELAAIVERISAAARAHPGDAERTERFLDALRKLTPAGRVPVRLTHPRLLKGSPDDIPLEDGDDLFIPRATSTVIVAGAVVSPGRYPAPETGRAREAIRAAGGFSERADRRTVILVTAEGTAAPLSEGWIRWDEANGRWEFTAFGRDSPRIGPGDAVIVPEKTDRLPWTRDPGDFPALLARIIAITGTVVLP
ncbi:MAG: SLBB domain-containing protein [Deltaproteobacteria bacterium]|nr:SLBB domain-containing protein [Deltaproteobacteria bacterium]